MRPLKYPFAVLVFLCALAIAPSHAQSSWTLKSPYVPPKTLRGVTWAGSQWVAVGDSGLIATSPDARTWTHRSVGADQRLKSVAWTGSRIVAVGTNSHIWSSTDGVIWTPSDFQGDFNDVIWAGVQCVAVGRGIMTSPDGVTWTGRASGVSGYLYAVAFTGSSLRAVGGDDSDIPNVTSSASTSPDGITWTGSESKARGNDVKTGLAWTGSQFLSVERSGTIHWIDTTAIRLDYNKLEIVSGTGEALNSIPMDYPLDVAHHAGTLVVVGGGSILVSTNGGTVWTSSIGLPATLTGVAASGNDIVALGGDMAATRSTNQGQSWQPAFSAMGQSWTPAFKGATIASWRFQDILWTGTQYVAMASSSSEVTTRVFTSSSPTNWSMASITSFRGRGLAARGDTLIAVGTAMARKLPNASWAVTLAAGQPEGPEMFAAAWTGSRFAAAGAGPVGSTLTSPEGLNWTRGVTSSPHAFLDMVWTGTHLVAVGRNGVGYISLDGKDWTEYSTGSGRHLKSLAWSGKMLAAVGAHGEILVSPNGASWGRRTSGTNDTIQSVAWTGSKFVAVTHRGAWLEASEDSPPFVPAIPTLLMPQHQAIGVSPTPTLTWNASEGAANYRIQVSTNTAFRALVLDTLVSSAAATRMLATNTRYYWRVQAIGTGTSSFWSTTRSFITHNTTLATPVLNYPPADTTQMPQLLTLEWNAVAGATAYEVQVANNPAFSPSLILNDTAVSGVTRLLGGLSTARTYYWRLRAKNAEGPGPWSSSTRRFSTGTVTLLDPPLLVSPAANGTAGSDGAVLVWNKVAGATGYRAQVAQDTGFLYLVLDDSTNADSSTLTTKALPVGASYFWRVYARSTASASLFSPARSFTVALSPPLITTQPDNRTGLLGGQAGFRVVTTGAGPFTYRWRKGSTPLADGGAVSGAATDSLTLGNLSLADTGIYNVVVSQEGSPSSTSANVFLYVNTPPSITAHPVNQALVMDTRMTFSVTANPGPGSSAGTLSYAWRKDSVLLYNGGRFDYTTTRELTLYHVNMTDTGKYYAIVTRTLNGTVTSTTSLPGLMLPPVAGLAPGAFAFSVRRGGLHAFRIPAMAGAERITIRIADTRGKRVWSTSFLPTGEARTVTWNGKSLNGQDVPPGVYIVRITARHATGASESLQSPVTLMP